MDGVTTFGSANATAKVRKSSGINVPKLGTKASPLNQDRDNISGEENLKDDAIKEIDYEFNKINSAQRNSPIDYKNGKSIFELR